MKKFVFIVRHTSPNRFNEFIKEHPDEQNSWLNGLRNRGLYVSSGPFADGTGGIMIIQAESADEANRLRLSQPFLKAGVSAIEMKEWDEEGREAEKSLRRHQR